MARIPLEGLRLADGPAHPQLFPGYYQNAPPRGSGPHILLFLSFLVERSLFPVRRSLSDSREILVGLCHKKPRVRDTLPCFAGKSASLLALALCLARRNRTTMPPAGGDAQVRPSAFQLVAVAPRKPPIRPPGSVLCCLRARTGGTQDHPLELRCRRTPSLPFRFVRTSGSCKRASPRLSGLGL